MKNVQEVSKKEQITLDGGVHNYDGKGCMDEINPFQPLQHPLGIR